MSPTMESQRLAKTTGWLPYFMLIVAGLGLAATALMGRFDLTIFSLVLVVPLALAATVLLLNKNTRDWTDHVAAAYDRSIGFQHLFLVNMLILVISTMILVSQPTRTFAYFILVALSSGVLLMQIVGERPKWTDNLILLQIMLLSLSLIWGLTLKYPLYFGDTDLLVHMNMIRTITQTGHMATYYLAYQQYQLYHILAALGVEITGASIRTGLFVLMGLAWQVGIIFAFLIFRYLSKSTRFALVGCLLFALSAQVVYYGSYSLPRSLAFVLLMGWLYLIIDKAQKSAGYVFLSMVILAAMIMTHHLNVIYTIPVLFVIYVCQLFVNRFRREHTIGLLFIYLLFIGSVSYLVWAAYSLSSGSLQATWRELITTEESLKSLSGLTKGLGIDVVLGTLYYSFALFLCLLGIQTVLKHLHQNDTRQTDGTFGLAGFVLLLVYVPGFLYLIPLSNIFMTDRLSLIVSPFAAFLTAYGMLYLYHASIFSVKGLAGRISYYLIPVGLMVTTTFFSTISVGNAKDTDYFVHTKNVDSPYFTQSELDSFSFLSQQANTKLTFYTDYATSRNDYSFGIPAGEPWVYVYAPSTAGNDKPVVTTRSIIRTFSEARNGYLILRLAELQRKQSLAFLPPGTSEQPIRYPLAELDPQLDALARSPTADEVYSDRDVEVYLTK